MGGTATIGIPDTSSLPVQSNLSQYDLRNAAAAMTPQAQPPPEMSPDQSIAELQQNATASFLRPQEQYQIPPDFQQPQFQQPQQFDQPQFTSSHTLQPAIDQLVAQMQQENQQKGQGVMKHLMTSFLGGMGRGMMAHAGLELPEHRQQQQLQTLVDLSNADANQQLKNIETQRYAMDIQRQPVIDPTTGQPVLDPQTGQPLIYPKWQAEKLQQGLVEKMNQRPERWTPEQQVYANSSPSCSHPRRG